LQTCVFCQIIEGRLPAEVLYEDDDVLVIRDIAPQAPVHLLVFPREHVPSAADVSDGLVWSKVMAVAVSMARDLGLVEQGFRLVVNTGDGAGQTIPHLHVHLLAGRPLRWPPG
jgi:histidine triad (HIT) family protein